MSHKEIIEYIVWYRKKHHISQRELARRSGVLQQHIALIETGRRVPRLNTLVRLCSALELIINIEHID